MCIRKAVTQSNAWVSREPGEKWPDDVNGEPSDEWLHLVEKSAFEKLKSERDAARTDFENVLHALDKRTEERDRLKAENEELLKSSVSRAAHQTQERFAQDLRKERDELLAFKNQFAYPEDRFRLDDELTKKSEALRVTEDALTLARAEIELLRAPHVVVSNEISQALQKELTAAREELAKVNSEMTEAYRVQKLVSDALTAAREELATWKADASDARQLLYAEKAKSAKLREALEMIRMHNDTENICITETIVLICNKALAAYDAGGT